MPKPMIATYRMIFFPEDEVSGAVQAETLRQLVEAELDEEDSIDMTQLLDFNTTTLSPIESVDVLRKARNVLIRTKIKQCWDLASELHRTAHILLRRHEGFEDPLVDYDYGSFIEVSQQVLTGKNPLT